MIGKVSLQWSHAAPLCARLTHVGTVDDEATIKVASKKNPPSTKPKGRLVFKAKAIKVKEAGDYERGILAEGACAQYFVAPTPSPTFKLKHTC